MTSHIGRLVLLLCNKLVTRVYLHSTNFTQLYNLYSFLAESCIRKFHCSPPALDSLLHVFQHLPFPFYWGSSSHINTPIVDPLCQFISFQCLPVTKPPEDTVYDHFHHSAIDFIFVLLLTHICTKFSIHTNLAIIVHHPIQITNTSQITHLLC